jgi:hypothetical protein
MEEVMKQTSLFLVTSLVTILICGGPLAVNLQAQSNHAMTVSIPFPFTVGGHSIAPGTYQLSLESDPFLLSVRNVKTGHEDIFPVRPEQPRGFEPQGRLIFGNSAGSRVLNEVRFPGTGTFTEVIQRHAAGRIEAKGSSTSNSVSVAQR